MGIYHKYIMPHIIQCVCSIKPTMQQRRKVIPRAKGSVLEIGVGTGLNLPLYDGAVVQHIDAVDPSSDNWRVRKVDENSLPMDVRFIAASAENLPLDSNSYDTVVMTYTMCSIPDIPSAMEEIRRVLKPNGELIFCEHGKAPDKSVLRIQNAMNPMWRHFGGGCNLNRDIPALIRENGFKLKDLDADYIAGWRPLSFNYWGGATMK